MHPQRWKDPHLPSDIAPKVSIHQVLARPRASGDSSTRQVKVTPTTLASNNYSLHLLSLSGLEHLPSSTRRMSTKAIMLQSHAAKRALQSLPRTTTRQFSSTPAASAISPYRKQSASTPQPTRRNVSDTATRPAQAAAAATQTQRTVPSPAFNRDADPKPQPLQPFRQPEMDHSFVGMKGGEIFHEMMLRHDVKHVCEWGIHSTIKKRQDHTNNIF